MSNNFYSRQTSSANEPTQVAGFGGNPSATTTDKKTDSSDSKGKGPVVGFLYSVSRNGFGEFWPIYTGQNIIGRAEDCDIKLLEKTVSAHHADIRAKILKKSGAIVANIKDTGSKNGLAINDEELRYEEQDLKDGDKILVGDAYELLFILIDPKAKGLRKAENFCECEETPEDPFGYNSYAAGAQSNDATHSMYDHNNRNTKGTVNLDSAADADSGHTTIL